MVHLAGWSVGLRRASRQLRPGLARITVMLAVLLLAGVLAGCSSQTSTAKLRNQGRGGADVFWNTAGTGGASSAIAWAKSFLPGQPNAPNASNYNFLCLAFVANAYGSEYAYYNTAWEQAQASDLKDPKNPAAAPPGALMFFDLSHPPAGPSIPEGHVGLSLGGGAMISSHTHAPFVEITKNIQTDTYWGPTYRGWTWPPAKWGPLAKQAAAGQNTVASKPKPPTTSNPQGPTYNPQGPTYSPQPQPVTPAPKPPSPAPKPPSPAPKPPSPVVSPVVTAHYYETAGGGGSPTFTNYMNAGGTLGTRVPAYTTVEVSCKVTGFKVADGNTWWYRLTSWDGSTAYYASADNYYNNGATSGSLSGTPFVDPAVPNC